MSVTMLMFRDKPWDGWNPDTDLEEVAGYIPLLVDKTFTGNVIHMEIDILNNNSEATDLGEQHGYLVLMNDNEVHSDDLYVMFFGSEGPYDSYILKILVALQGITKANPVDGTQWSTGTLARFDGGAQYVRNLFADNNRKMFRTVD